MSKTYRVSVIDWHDKSAPTRASECQIFNTVLFSYEMSLWLKRHWIYQLLHLYGKIYNSSFSSNVSYLISDATFFRSTHLLPSCVSLNFLDINYMRLSGVCAGTCPFCVCIFSWVKSDLCAFSTRKTPSDRLTLSNIRIFGIFSFNKLLLKISFFLFTVDFFLFELGALHVGVPNVGLRVTCPQKGPTFSRGVSCGQWCRPDKYAYFIAFLRGFRNCSQTA
jgi:hypothetical protein